MAGKRHNELVKNFHKINQMHWLLNAGVHQTCVQNWRAIINKSPIFLNFLWQSFFNTFKHFMLMKKKCLTFGLFRSLNVKQFHKKEKKRTKMSLKWMKNWRIYQISMVSIICAGKKSKRNTAKNPKYHSFYLNLPADNNIKSRHFGRFRFHAHTQGICVTSLILNFCVKHKVETHFILHKSFISHIGYIGYGTSLECMCVCVFQIRSNPGYSFICHHPWDAWDFFSGSQIILQFTCFLCHHYYYHDSS